jgi:hypothetical protein
MGYIYTTRQLNAIEVLIHKLYNWELYIYIRDIGLQDAIRGSG